MSEGGTFDLGRSRLVLTHPSPLPLGEGVVVDWVITRAALSR